MDARDRWQALQAHLSASRRALDEGNRPRAIDEVNAALAIDPEFAAARALRERLDSPERLQPPAFDAPAVRVAEPARTVAAPRPVVSAEGFARFEERARRRRIERRAEAARGAIASGKVREARVAIDEIRGLDPNAPEIPALVASVDLARHPRSDGRRSGWHPGPRLAAATAFATIVLAVSWVERPERLLSYPVAIATALIATAQPAPLIATSAVDEAPPVGTFGEDRSVVPESSEPLARPSSSVTLSEITPTVSPGPPPPTVAPSTSTAAAMPAAVAASFPPPSPVAPPPPPVASPPAPAPAETPTVVEAKPADDVLVRYALQQYKTAYDALDARSAQAVWPVVNERALARAFDGLESQQLVFDACDVQVKGDGATAMCRGIARYVAKVGSREPRTEPRVWSFTLRKHGADWKIESARAER